MDDATLTAWLVKEIEHAKRQIERHTEGVKSDNVEYASGSRAFLAARQRDLRIYELALGALGGAAIPVRS